MISILSRIPGFVLGIFLLSLKLGSILWQVTAFTVKVILVTFFQIVVRWTLPRFRYDQLMRLGWQGLLPLAIVNLVLTAAAVLAFGVPT